VNRQSPSERFGTETGELITLAERPTVPADRPIPTVPWFFAAAMAVALALAATAGLGLGVAAALEVWIGQSNWTAAVQGHGRIQLFGFAAVFIGALTFEFIVRLNTRPAIGLGPRLTVLLLICVGGLLSAVAQLVEVHSTGILVAATMPGLVGGLGFLALVVRVHPARSWRDDLHPWFFRAAATWLVVASVLVTVGAWRAIDGVFPLVDSRAAGELMLRGFVLNTVFAVALRALPGHLNVVPMGWRRQLVVFSALNFGLALWTVGSGVADQREVPFLMRTADVLLAGTVLAFTVWSGVLTAFRLPRSGAPRYQSLVPLAWLGLFAYGCVLLAFAFAGGLSERSLYQEGTVRHILMLGFMAPLMVAFAHIVLARFGTGTIPNENALTVAFILVVIAWPMRVAPGLFVDVPSDTGRMVIGLAGLLAATGLGLASLVCATAALHIRRLEPKAAR
jgi:hypothetical protein